jgi:hypothetical protein
MDTFTKASLIWLSLQLGIMGYAISRLAYDLGYERGKEAVYQSFAEDGSEGTCFAPKGCKEVNYDKDQKSIRVRAKN